jgi:hypothetical protein
MTPEQIAEPLTRAEIETLRRLLEADMAVTITSDVILGVIAHIDTLTAAVLDVERLARAITMHSIAQRANGPEAYFGHKCMGDCAADIAREYAEEPHDA